MEARKLLIKTAYCLAGLLILALSGLSLFQHQQIKKLSRDVDIKTLVTDESAGDSIPGPAEIPEETDTQRTAVAGIDKETSKAEIEDLEYQLEAAEEELDMAHEQLFDELVRKEELRKKELELQKQYRENPSYRIVMRNSLERQYGDLFDELNLSPEKLEEFKDILLDNQMAYSDFYTDIQSVTPSEEKRAEFEQRQKALREDQQTKIKEFLGNEDYEKYQEDRMTWGLKYQVTNFMANLGSEEELTETQQQELIEAMKGELQNIGSETSEDDDKFLFPSETYEEKNIEQMLESQDRMNEAYLNAAGGILSSSQTEKFKECLEQQREMYESSMKMQALRYGNSITQESDDN